MKPARLAIVVVTGLVLVGVALFVLGSKRSARIEELQKAAQTDALYKRADVYFKGSDEDKKYVEDLFAYGTEVAKQNLNGFFSPPPDKQKYYTHVYQAMITQAKEKGRADLARSLQNWAVGQGYLDLTF